jgi:hypothetical protein
MGNSISIRLSDVGVLDGLLEGRLKDHEADEEEEEVAVEIGKTPLLSWYALQPGQHDQDEEGSCRYSQLQVAASGDLDGCVVGGEGDRLRLLVDLEHVYQHLIQFDEAHLSEVVARRSLLRLCDVVYAQIFKRSPSIPLEVFHGDEDAAI